jgi:hypothetical protein
MRNIFNLTTILTLLLVTSSCSKETTQLNTKLDSSTFYANAASANFTVIKSIQASNEANQLRSTDYSAVFEISKVTRNKESLQITATYPIGCGDSKFELIWNGLTTLPPKTVIIYLRRTSVCAALALTSSQTLPANSISQTLTINLTDWLGDASSGQNVIVLLCNTSKKTNTENSDILASVK